MTECVYSQPLTSFEHAATPAPVYHVPVLQQGRQETNDSPPLFLSLSLSRCACVFASFLSLRGWTLTLVVENVFATRSALEALNAELGLGFDEQARLKPRCLLVCCFTCV